METHSLGVLDRQPGENLRQPGTVQNVLGDRIESTFFDDPRQFQNVIQDPKRDEVEHDCDNHLVSTRLRPQQAWNEAPEHPSENSGDDGKRKVDDPWQSLKGETDEDRSKTTDRHLPFGTDIEQARLEADRDRETGQDQRG